jgi:hypothetical protein
MGAGRVAFDFVLRLVCAGFHRMTFDLRIAGHFANDRALNLALRRIPRHFIAFLEIAFRHKSTLDGFGNNFCGLRSDNRMNRNLATCGFGATIRLEGDDAIGFGEERVIDAHADICARQKARAALTNQNAAGGNGLSAEGLDAQSLRVGIAPVAR